MSNSTNSLLRQQLAKFVPDPRTLRALEQIIDNSMELTPENLQNVNIAASNAAAAANEAIALILQLASETATNTSVIDVKANDALSQVANLKNATLINNATNESKINEALGLLGDISKSLALLASSPVIQNNNSTKTDYVEFATLAPIPAHKTGNLFWNNEDETLNSQLADSATLKVGHALLYHAKNDTAGTLNIGTPVMFSGTVGASGKLKCVKAVANGTYPSEYMMGVMLNTTATNVFGYVVQFGLIRGFDTSGTPYGEVWADGDLLYFSATTAGAWTKNKPAAPNINVPVAVVVNAASGGSGSIFVRMEISEELRHLQDVYISGGIPANNDMLVYVLANNRWENKTPSQTRDALGLGTGSPVNGSLLIGNGGTGEFDTANLGAGTNIAVTNGAGSVSVAFTSYAAPSNNDALIYVSANNRWENKTPSQTRDALGLGTGSPVNGSLLIGNGGTGEFDTALLSAGSNIDITFGAGSISIALDSTILLTEVIATDISGDLTNTSTSLMSSTATLTNGAGVSVGTLTNAPAAGNPTKWVAINDNGTTRYIPAW